jgi:hypothetical protein
MCIVVPSSHLALPDLPLFLLGRLLLLLRLLPPALLLLLLLVRPQPDPAAPHTVVAGLHCLAAAGAGLDQSGTLTAP